jgi:single-strand DNA-binding protein
MGRSLNKAMLIGNLGKDPELRYTTSGVAVATFSLATNEQWKDQDGNAQERTEWHNIVAWKKLAEICGEWLKKGKKVYVEGRIQNRSYDDKNTGTKRYISEIVAENIIMLDSKGSAESGSPSVSTGETVAAPAAAVPAGRIDDDLPF